MSLFECTDDTSTIGFTAQTSPQYAVEMHRYQLSESESEQKGMGAVSEGFGGVDPATGQYVVSYSNMAVHLHPVE